MVISMPLNTLKKPISLEADFTIIIFIIIVIIDIFFIDDFIIILRFGHSDLSATEHVDHLS